MPTKHYVAFEVVPARPPATGRFPIDMLRYDSCYPESEHAASLIQASLGRGTARPWTERLVRRIRVGMAVMGVTPEAMTQLHDACTADGVSEETFYFAWRAAIVLDEAARPAPHRRTS